MKRRALIKVCGMIDPNNVRRIAELKPDLLGFIFVPESPRFIGTCSQALQVVRHVPASITSVGVFRDASLQDVVRAAEALHLGVVQLHGVEDEQYVGALRNELPASIKIWKAISVGRDPISALSHAPHGADLIVLDGPRSGSGERFNWTPLMEDGSCAKPFLLAGGIGPESINEARRLFEAQQQCLGIDLNSQVESVPGIKEIEGVRRCIEGMRV